MKILVDGWFTLPRLGRETFALLMKQGVEYDKELGFRVDSQTDLESAVRTIALAVGEEVQLTLRCYVCGQESCPGCPYLVSCDRRKVSSLCLCGEHAPSEGVYGTYKKIFRANLEA